jgi:CRISPR-associated protein Csb2
MFALGIHYLTGYATATDTSSRERAEWPPHPARVFMALVAAHYEGAVVEPDTAERAALEWLEALPPPAFKASDAESRRVVTHYVPVNDKASPPNSPNRQPRTFPKIRPQDDTAFLIWESAVANEVAIHAAALARLCEKVTRVGHSTSLVQMWLVPPGAGLPAPDLFPVPDNATSHANVGETHHLRVTAAGTLSYLDEVFNKGDIEMFFDLKARIGAATGREKRELKAQFLEKFGDGKTGPNRTPPVLALTRVYSRKNLLAATNQIQPFPQFDEQLLILAKLDGPALGLESTCRLANAMRGAILKKCIPNGGGPEWLTGHAPDGAATTAPHLAILPLAFAGPEHADGHLLGLALAFPRAIAPRERARWLRPLLYETAADGTAVPAIITLWLGALGVWTLAREERAMPPVALRPETWCSASTDWASVTPVVLDRHLKSKPTDPEKRFTEITDSIVESCDRIGLPRPVEIDVDKNAFLSGVPRSKPDKSGFPLLAPDRQQIHVRLRFPVPVTGPILIGLGRYRGYGLLKPLGKN